MKNPSKRFRTGCLLILFYVFSCSAPAEEVAEVPPEPVKVVTGEVSLRVEAPITTSPVTEANLRSPASGTLVSVPEVGQRVKAGEVVAKLDADSLKRAVLQARISVQEAGYSLEKQNQTLVLLKKTSESDEILAKENLITQESVATSRANLRREELQLQMLELALQKSKLSLEEALANERDASIKSPVAGVIASVSVQAGTYVEANAEICQIVDISRITLTGQVDEYDISKIRPGMKAQAAFDALENQSFPTTVRTVSPTAETINNVPVYTIGTRLDNPEQIIRPGMSGDLTITIAKQKGLIIPKDFVDTRDGNSFATVLVQGQPQSRRITLGQADQNSVVVSSGLEEGDLVLPKTKPVRQGSKDSTASGQNRTNRQQSLMGFSGPGGPPPGGF